MEQTTPPEPKYSPTKIITAVGAAASGLFGFLEPELVKGLLSDAWQLEVTKMTVAFMLAAWFHRIWVRKDMDIQFSKLTNALNNVATSFTNRLVNIESSMGQLTTRVEALESKKEKKK